MKTTFAPLALAALLLAAPALRADEESARKALVKEGIDPTPEALLHEAVSGNAKRVKLLLEVGVDPSFQGPGKQTAMWAAVDYKNLEVLKVLLAAGVKPDETNAPIGDYGKTIVLGAVDTGEAAYVKALADAGADVKKPNEYELTPLSVAAQAGYLEIVKVLLQAGADPNTLQSGFPMIFGPVVGNQIEVVRYLLEHGGKLGEHKASLLESAPSPEMKALLEKSE